MQFGKVAAVAAAFLLLGAEAGMAGSPADQAARVERVLKAVPLTDGHNDWAMALRAAYGPAGALKADLMADATTRKPPGHTDIPRLRSGRVGAQLWSAYVPGNLPPDEAVRQTLEQIAMVRSFAERYPDTFTLVTTSDGLRQAFAAGRIASLIALEGAHQVKDDVETLRKVHALGVRALTLSHSRNTKLFDSATDRPHHRGMARGGAAFIAEMNRLGMLVDLSHVSPSTMRAVLDVTRAPVIFSHSSAQGVTDHPRNVPDDVLRRLPANGGIVMVTYVPAFVNQKRADWERARTAARQQGNKTLAAFLNANPRPRATLRNVADHIDHIARVAGHDHVGLGGDFDGVDDLPAGLSTVATYPALLRELARRGWSEENLAKLAGGNFLRVFRQTEGVAAAMARDGGI